MVTAYAKNIFAQGRLTFSKAIWNAVYNSKTPSPGTLIILGGMMKFLEPPAIWDAKKPIKFIWLLSGA